jgi:hypothetical protein
MHLNKTSKKKDSQIHIEWKLHINKNIKLIHNCLNAQRKNKTGGEHKSDNIGPRFSHLASLLALLILHKEVHGYEQWVSYKRVCYTEPLVSATTVTTIIVVVVAVGMAIRVRLAVPRRLEILA